MSVQLILEDVVAVELPAETQGMQLRTGGFQYHDSISSTNSSITSITGKEEKRTYRQSTMFASNERLCQENLHAERSVECQFIKIYLDTTVTYKTDCRRIRPKLK